MPLSDFVRYLNAQLPWPTSALHSTTPFVSQGGQVLVYFNKLRLESAFSPIVDARDGALRGHAARLRATEKASRQAVDPDAVFRLPRDDDEFVFLDRLVRTLHTLNYLIYRHRHSGGVLLLTVHPRHVASVATDHGLAFEDILRGCGLLPKQITLELEIDGVQDSAHLARAVANYKSRGYSIGLGRIGRHDIDFALLRAIRPAFVKLDSRWISSAQPPLGRIIEELRRLDAEVILEGFDSAALRVQAGENGFDLLQLDEPASRTLPAPASALAAA